MCPNFHERRQGDGADSWRGVSYLHPIQSDPQGLDHVGTPARYGHNTWGTLVSRLVGKLAVDWAGFHVMMHPNEVGGIYLAFSIMTTIIIGATPVIRYEGG